MCRLSPAIFTLVSGSPSWRVEGTASVNTSMCGERPCWTLLTNQAVCFVRITENLCEDPLPTKSNQCVRVAGCSSLLVKVTDSISTAGFSETRVKTGPFHPSDVMEASVSSDSQSPGLASASSCAHLYTPTYVKASEEIHRCFHSVQPVRTEGSGTAHEFAHGSASRVLVGVFINSRTGRGISCLVSGAKVVNTRNIV